MLKPSDGEDEKHPRSHERVRHHGKPRENSDVGPLLSCLAQPSLHRRNGQHHHVQSDECGPAAPSHQICGHWRKGGDGGGSQARDNRKPLTEHEKQTDRKQEYRDCHAELRRQHRAKRSKGERDE